MSERAQLGAGALLVIVIGFAAFFGAGSTTLFEDVQTPQRAEFAEAEAIKALASDPAAAATPDITKGWSPSAASTLIHYGVAASLHLVCHRRIERRMTSATPVRLFSRPYVFQVVRFPGLARDGVSEGGGAPSGGSAIAV